MIRRVRSSRRTTRESYALSPKTDSGRRRGRPGRPATGGMPSTRARVCVMSLTFAAVVMTWSGVPFPSQIRWCLPPVFRRSTGDGPVASPLFWRGRGSRPRTRGSSRVRRPRSAPRAGCGATCRRRLSAASGPGAASRSAPSRTPVPGAGAAKRRPGAGHTECPADTAGPPSASAPETARAKAAATARSAPTSRRPRSTAESSHPPERSDRHNSLARPGPFNKIVLRAQQPSYLCSCAGWQTTQHDYSTHRRPPCN